jgi:hypothetical protein
MMAVTNRAESETPERLRESEWNKSNNTTARNHANAFLKQKQTYVDSFTPQKVFASKLHLHKNQFSI